MDENRIVNAGQWQWKDSVEEKESVGSWSQDMVKKEKVGGLSFQSFEMMNVPSPQSVNHSQAWTPNQSFRGSVLMGRT